MRGGSVPDGMRADRSAQQRWMGSRCRTDVVAQHPVDAMTSNRVAEPVEEDGFVWRAVADNGEQRVDGRWPKWAAAYLAALAPELHVAELVGTQVQIADQKGRGFRDTST